MLVIHRFWMSLPDFPLVLASSAPLSSLLLSVSAYSVIHPFTHSINNWLIARFLHSFVIHSLTHSLIDYSWLIHSAILLSIYVSSCMYLDTLVRSTLVQVSGGAQPRVSHPGVSCRVSYQSPSWLSAKDYTPTKESSAVWEAYGR